MNLILLMAEGSTEAAFLEVLLGKGLLRFSKEDLLMEKVFHARRLDGEIIGYIQLLRRGDDVSIYRVGDKLSDSLTIPKAILPEKIRSKTDVSTTPEFEVLFLINEGLYEAYLKEKSRMKPSSFYKARNRSYNKQASYVRDYFEQMSGEEIIHLVKRYVHLHAKSHPKGKKTLLEIMKP